LRNLKSVKIVYKVIRCESKDVNLEYCENCKTEIFQKIHNDETGHVYKVLPDKHLHLNIHHVMVLKLKGSHYCLTLHELWGFRKT